MAATKSVNVISVLKRSISYRSAIPKQAPAISSFRKSAATNPVAKKAFAKPAASVPLPKSTSTASKEISDSNVAKSFTSSKSSAASTTSRYVKKPLSSTSPSDTSYKASSARVSSDSNTASDSNPEPVASKTFSGVAQLETLKASDSEGWNASLLPGEEEGENWAKSFKGLGTEPFSRDIADILWEPLVLEEIEIKPDGLIYLPEIKYRRILNRAFGPGGWGLAPRSQTLVTPKMVSREYGLICHGRLVGIARGEQDYFGPNGVPTAMEGCKSNALMRCCKDLGIASELWDPNFIRDFKKKKCDSKYSKDKSRYVWKRKDREWEYPFNKD